LNENLERWRSLPPERRKEIQKLFERLRELQPAERKLLLERLRAMSPAERRQALERARGNLDPLEGGSRDLRRDLIRRQLEKLAPEERERLRQLSPEERREFVEKKFSSQREKILSRLSPELREKAEKLPPKERVEFLRRLRGEQLFKETFRSPREVEKLRNLPPRKLREALRVPPDGSPPPKPRFFSEETWKRWLELKPFERLRVLRQLMAPEWEQANG
jgi:Mg/Co/Ni transporter MgtE